jgi:hypothetical protein
MRTLALGLVLIAGCKDKPAAPPAPAPVPAKVIDAPIDAADPWTRCKTALAHAATAPATRRVQAILDGCMPCGEWTPILGWQLTPEHGGPDRRALDRAMTACDAWCVGDAKERFLGVVDDARVQESRAPWRALGEVCKAKVSATPDARYMSAPWFALDRVARWAAAQPGGQALLDAIELRVPAVSLTGVGVVLPEAPVVKPATPTTQVTVTASELSVGTLPTAKLDATGVVVTGGPYPGPSIAEKALAARLAKVRGPIALFAPAGLPATRVVAAVKAAGAAELQLAVQATSGVVGWKAYGLAPITLGTKPDAAGVELALGATPDAAVKAIKTAGPDALRKAPPTVQLAKGATVEDLATVLGALAYFEVTRVNLVVGKS